MVSVNHCSCFPNCGAHEKPCIECGRDLPLTEFYQHAMMGDGHLNKCKECVLAYQRVRRREKMLDPEWREAERARAREKFARLGRRWTPTSRHKRRAHTAVSNAVRDGRLVPADECEDCGHDFSEFRREAHHDDYDYPLDVRWLCSLCHGREHRRVA